VTLVIKAPAAMLPSDHGLARFSVLVAKSTEFTWTSVKFRLPPGGV